MQPNVDIGVPNFKRYTERKVNDNLRPYLQPEIYDHLKVESGLRALSDFKRTKGTLTFDKAQARSDIMYNFDKEAIRKIKLKLNKDNFSFSSYLPNGLNQVKSPPSYEQSQHSLASTAASALKNLHRLHSRNEYDDKPPPVSKSRASSYS